MKKKFIDISKLMLKEIFSYISDKKKLEIIKYNKKIQNKLDITKFIYQKIHFNSIVTQTTLDNPFILLEKNKFDKETLDKLISEWKEEIEEESDIPEKESLTQNFYFGYEITKDEKKKFFEDLNNIFGCKYLSEDSTLDLSLDDENNDFDWWFSAKLKLSKFLDENRYIFKDPDIVFDEKNIGKLNYFHLTITIKIFWGTSGGHIEYDNLYVYDYLFSKTKGNKYLFKTKFDEIHYSDDISDYKWTVKKIRYCNTKRFKDYYFINNEIELKGYGDEIDNKKYRDKRYLSFVSEEESQEYWDDFDFDEFNTVKIYETEYNSIFGGDYLWNNLETIHLDCLEEKSNIIDCIKKWSELKCFIIDTDCELKNCQLIELFKNLSSLKSLFLIDISFINRLKLKPKEKQTISELFPNLSFGVCSLKWKKNLEKLYNLKIKS